MMKNILAAYDGSESSRIALDFACELSKKFGSHLHVIAVCQPPDFGGEVELQDLVKRTKKHFNLMLNHLKKHYSFLGDDTRFEVVIGHPAEQLLRYADGNEIDHIVLGHRGNSKFERWLLGSVARQVIDHARCPVTVIRQQNSRLDL